MSAYHTLPDPRTHPEFYRSVVLKRALAWCVDFALIGILAVILVPLTAFTAVFFFAFFAMVVGFLYRWFTLASGSATWGMRLFSIEIRNGHGEKLSSQEALMHTLGYTVSVMVAPLQLVSIVLMLLTERKQGLTDHFMGTAAINRPL
ncbi:RDD family protein [Marivivens sp. LCG002]|uniref:RDD family protein n=1 Tax=Marivivens sp. LCG002 TaxID=3051171 RepID=UPI0025526B75|nr:RDD family protein [Marivivens sp. LCG002]WIV49489.1 RDD family protein [Marivivens sp. LCG002]